MNPQDLPVLTFFAMLSVAGQILIVLLVVILVLHLTTKNKMVGKIVSLISANAIILGLIVSALAVLGSLYSSEVAGLVPCKLCWFQRIFMYPLPVILIVSLLTNDTKVRRYVLPLAVLGLIFAFYHILLQMYPNVLQCGDELVSCATENVKIFGYVTVPVMSATAFLLTILFLIFPNSAKNKN